jgi:hypothetical protein
MCHMSEAARVFAVYAAVIVFYPTLDTFLMMTPDVARFHSGLAGGENYLQNTYPFST